MTIMKVDLPNPPNNVIHLTVKRQDRLERAMAKECQHHEVEVDTQLAELVCKECNARLNPIEWIANTIDYWGVYIGRQHANYWRERRYAEAAEAALERRSRVKCRHCKQFTEVHPEVSGRQMQIIRNEDPPPGE